MIKQTLSRVILFILFISTTILLQGCLHTDGTQTAEMDIPPVPTTISSHEDIVLPPNLTWNSGESMAIKTASFKGGIFHYSGRVELLSLKEFLKTSMADNKWKLVGEASYEKTMLAFIKPNKTCMIMLWEGIGGTLGRTHVKLYVTADLAAAKGLNPFGEPIQ